MSSMVQSKSGDWGFSDDLEEGLIARVREIRPLLQRNAPLNEQARNLTPEVLKALDEIPGIWSMAVPRRWGGLGMSCTSMARIGAELAKGDPTVSWLVQIIGGTTWVASLSSDETQEALFGKGIPKICGAYNPPGAAKPVDGGYLVSGKFPYSSGCKIASWFQWGGILKKADGTTLPGNFCYVPMSDVTIEDSWFTAGLQGTGSDTGVIKDAFVPEHLFVSAERSYGVRYPGKKHCTAPSDYWPQVGFVHRSGAGQLVGMAEAMLEYTTEAAKTRGIPMTIFTKQMDSSLVQRDIAEAAIKIQTARMLIERSTREVDETALAKATLPALDRARNKVQASYAVQLLSESIDKLMFVAGSNAFNNANPLSRYWRDYNVAARHIANLPNIGLEVYGRALLGVEPNIVPPFMI